jgi:hypothetical protein
MDGNARRDHTDKRANHVLVIEKRGERTMPDPELHHYEDLSQNDPAGYLRYVPSVTFGLRVAALAGIAVTAGAAGVAGLSGIFDAPDAIAAWPWPGSTCCITLAG